MIFGRPLLKQILSVLTVNSIILDSVCFPQYSKIHRVVDAISYALKKNCNAHIVQYWPGT